MNCVSHLIDIRRERRRLDSGLWPQRAHNTCYLLHILSISQEISMQTKTEIVGPQEPICSLASLSNSTEQRPPWETASHTATHEVSCVLWSLRFHCRVQKDPPLSLSWSRKLRSHRYSFLWMFPWRYRSSKQNFSYSFSDQIFLISSQSSSAW